MDRVDSVLASAVTVDGVDKAAIDSAVRASTVPLPWWTPLVACVASVLIGGVGVRVFRDPSGAEYGAGAVWRGPHDRVAGTVVVSVDSAPATDACDTPMKSDI